MSADGAAGEPQAGLAAAAAEASPGILEEVLLGASEGDDPQATRATPAAPSRPAENTVDRLRADGEPAARWRDRALKCYAEGRHDEFRQVLEAAVQQDANAPNMTGADRGAMLHLLAVHHIGQASSAARGLAPAERTAELARAKELLDEVENIDRTLGSVAGVHVFTGRGFHALARYALSPVAGNELKRAESLFGAALKLEPTSAHAVLGQAIVLTHHKEWGQALERFRQVLRRLSPTAPRSGTRLRSLRQLRFALAVCFCGLGRFEQTHNSLVATLASSPGDVEALCALATLEAKISKDGIGKSMEYLDEAVKANQDHPVTLCQLANHAFYCGLEERQEGGTEAAVPEPWQQAAGFLERVLQTSNSPPVRAEALYQQGRLMHAQGQYVEAHERYSGCRDLSPEHYACAFGLAQTCVQQQRYEEAVSTLEKLREQRGELPEVLKLLTYAYLVSGKAKEAAQCADVFVAKSKDDLEVLAMRAEAHDQLTVGSHGNEPPKAGVEAYEQVAALAGKNGSNGCTPEMWNNLGTMRSLDGDLPGARDAYNQGLDLVEKRIAERKADEVEKKDLRIAQITMRFNQAWVAESLGDQPNFAQATQDYMILGEENNWFADTLLRLGAQWQRMGEMDLAVQRYQDAMRQNPVLGALMQAEAFRHRGDHVRALQSGETAVRHAGSKQFHYAHVFLGNLYYEAATAHTTKSRELQDQYLCKALRNFHKALRDQKDSHYAANGIGMVFAQRGKMDLARRTFQSVVQHQAMAKDPSVYINLAHTYVRSGGEDVRKAIALYGKARKLNPNDLAIRLYIAQAHHGLREFEHCAGVLGDALQMWPDDLLLRYNMAIALEGHGRFLVNEEKKTHRVVGMDNAKDQMVQAVELLGSAARLFEHVHHEWSAMDKSERAALRGRSGVASALLEEMDQADKHKEFCQVIADAAKEHLQMLTQKRQHMDRTVQKIEEQKEKHKKEREAADQEDRRIDQERLAEAQERAVRLMETTGDIELGRNLEQAWKPTAKAGIKKPGKGGLPRVTDTTGVDEEPLSIQDHEMDEDERRKRKKDKKDKKDKKKDKKEKKKDKKHKKRGREDYAEGYEDVDGGEQMEGPVPTIDQSDDGEGRPVLPMVDPDAPQDVSELEPEVYKEKKEKKDKKSKKDKKEKKARKAAKRAELDKADEEAEKELFGDDGEDGKGMEDELFGPDDD